MAFNLGDIMATVKLNTASLQSGLGDVQNMGEQTKTLGQKIQTGLNVAATGLAVVGGGLSVYAKNATDYTTTLVKNAKSLGTQLGISTTAASTLSAAVSRVGIDSGSAASMFGLFEKQIVSATQTSTANTLATQKLQLQIDATKNSIQETTVEIDKNGDSTGALKLKLAELNNTLATQQNSLNSSQNAFEKLGISTLDSTGKQKDFNTLLFETADKFQAMPDGIDKTNDAMELFGRNGGKDMLKFLDLGSSGIQTLENKATALGLTITTKTIGSISKLVTAQKNLKDQTDSIKIAVGTATAPILTTFDKAISNLVQTLLNGDPHMRTITADFLAFGGPVATGAGALLGFAANLDQAVPLIEGFGKALMNPYILGFAAVIGAIALVADGLQQKMGGWSGVAKDIGDKLQHIEDALSTFVPSFSGIETDMTNEGQKLAGLFANSFLYYLRKMKGVAEVVLGKLKNGDYEGAGKELANGILKGLESLRHKLGTLFDMLTTELAKIDWVGIGITLGGKIVPGLALGIAAGLLNLDFAKLFDEVKAHWLDIFLGVLAIILAPAKIADGIAEILLKIPFAGKFLEWGFSGIRDGGQAVIGKLWDWFKLFGEAFIDALGIEEQTVIPAIIRFFKAIPDTIANIAGTVDNAISNMMINIGDRIANLGPAQVVGGMQKVKNAIFGFIGDAGSWLYNAGSSLISGFIKGIGDRFGDVKTTLQNLTKKLTDWKGPPDTDKKLLFGSGKFVIGGFVKGLQASFDTVKNTLGTLTSSIAPTVAMNLVNQQQKPVIGNPIANTSNSNQSNSFVQNNYITQNIPDKSTADYYISKLDRNNKLESMGLSPATLGTAKQ